MTDRKDSKTRTRRPSVECEGSDFKVVSVRVESGTGHKRGSVPDTRRGFGRITTEGNVVVLPSLVDVPGIGHDDGTRYNVLRLVSTVVPQTRSIPGYAYL